MLTNDPQWMPGAAIVLGGECLRLWAVGHIGLPSRTRDADVASLIRSGPFQYIRNPLYLANIVMFFGVGLWSGWGWAAAWMFWLALQYHFIVRWEEGVLVKQLGEPYRDYCEQVSRWIPARRRAAKGQWQWRTAVRSERSTWVAIALVWAAFWWG